MSSYEDNRIDSAFAEMMLAEQLDVNDPASLGLRVVPMDYQRVGIDAEEGEGLHELLKDAHNDAEIALKDVGLKLEENPIVAGIVSDVLQNAACVSEKGDAFQELFAIEGFGWFGVQKPGEKRHLKDGLLLPGERLFGKLSGLAFGQYHTIDNKGIEKLLSTGETPDSKPKPGALIGITEVSVCAADADGLGEIDRTFDTIFVPVKIPTLMWARAYKL